MAKFLLLYRAAVSPEEQMAKASPEEAQAGMEAWNAWGAKAGPSIIDMGSPTALRETLGSASAGGNHLGGFSIMEAGSLDTLKELLDGHPHLMMDGSGIEVHELLEMPGQS